MFRANFEVYRACISQVFADDIHGVEMPRTHVLVQTWGFMPDLLNFSMGFAFFAAKGCKHITNVRKKLQILHVSMSIDDTLTPKKLLPALIRFDTCFSRAMVRIR